MPLDILHDFFVEELPDIRRNFNPDKAAAFSTYLYSAFVRFARARIQRLHRQQRMLLDPKMLMELQDSISAPPSPEDSVDWSQVSTALAQLTPAQRRLVDNWLTRNPYSERELAREMGISRYKLREQLVDAVGQISLHFAAHTQRGDVDHRVAEAIWRDKLTPAEAAAALGLSEQQVRNARARNYQRIVQALVSTPAQPARIRNVVMSEESVQTLLAKIFGNAPVQALESAVAQQAPALVQYLVESDEAVAHKWQGLPADRLACVYEAIARGMGTVEGFEPEVNEDDPLFVAHANDRRAVGRAFAEALVPALPDGLFPLLLACQARLRIAPRQVVEQLRREPDVLVGGNAAQTLAEFGLKPSHIVVATDAVAMFIERAVAVEHFPQDHKLLFVRGRADERTLSHTVQSLTHEASGANLTRAEMAQEISAVASVDADTGEVLLDWLVDTAPYVKSLLSGFSAETARDNVLLRPRPESTGDLYVRWSNPRLTTKEFCHE